MGKKKAMKVRKPKPAPKGTKRRSAVTGRYGDGAKAAEKLARRIMVIIGDEGYVHVTTGMLERIKAELLAATTVTESAAKVIGSGWVFMEGSKAEINSLGETIGFDSYDSITDTPMQYVKLVAATPPRARAARKGGRK